jgi:Uma2 family endonuclease
MEIPAGGVGGEDENSKARGTRGGGGSEVNLVPNAHQGYPELAMSGLLHLSPELGFTREDLADLPDAFPPCVIRDGKIARADGRPLEWEQYDLLGEDFPATLTETGELEMSPRPTPAHEGKAANLFTLLNHVSTCQREGRTYLGPELRIRPYRRTVVPDVMFFRNAKAEWSEESVTHIDQIPDLAVEIVSPSNKGKKWEDNLAFYQQARFPEFWLVQLDGAVEIWRVSQTNIHITCRPGELFSSPLFPGLAIDPAWIKNCPEEIMLIRKFSPEVRVLRDPDEPELTKRARKMAARIAKHFGEAPPSRREKKRQSARRLPILPPASMRQDEPGREQER